MNQAHGGQSVPVEWLAAQEGRGGTVVLLTLHTPARRRECTRPPLEPKLSVFALGMIATTKSRTSHHHFYHQHRPKSPFYNHLKSHTGTPSPVHKRDPVVLLSP
ncbi:hypothetical protein E2C01_000759 [Portunus trituberculatus]|uniref:Uncharacterized protein n=1 Tax=Portunus trituberculatus TaxID=210409 RepID=A0A5B7CEZ2_PORTR|nr:hypothetical protein [Portunus trituberculatus]